MDYKQLYHDALVDHYKHPRNKGTVEPADFSSGVYNPSCGDQVLLSGTIENATISRCLFEAKGCVISNAAASMMTELCTGMSVDKALQLTKDDMLALVKIELGPTRLRCALLALQALHNGLREFQKRNENVASGTTAS